MNRQSAKFKVSPFFLPGETGRLFSIIYKPVKCDVKKAVLILPPFAEEMNRSRRAMSMLAQQLAAEGTAAFILDLYGTGDSEGDFIDARWTIWLDDANSALNWLLEQGYKTVSILGVRMAAMLVSELASLVNYNFKNIIFWQPVLSGQAMMAQFLRVAVAANLTQSNNVRMNSTALHEQLLSGVAVEVGGYMLSPKLYQDIYKRKLDLNLKYTAPVIWLETTVNHPGSLSAVNQALVNEWRLYKGIDVKILLVNGGHFWTVFEETDYSELIKNTVLTIIGNSLHE